MMDGQFTDSKKQTDRLQTRNKWTDNIRIIKIVEIKV